MYETMHDMEADPAAVTDGQGRWPEGIPVRLDEMAPGPILAAWLATIDVRRVSGHDRVVVLRARQRLASHYAAKVLEDMSAVTEVFLAADPDVQPAIPLDAATAEIRTALNLTRRAAENEIGLALDLEHRLPEVGAALASGDIDPRRARAIAHGTTHLSDDAARRIGQMIAPDAPSMTTGELRAAVRLLCIEADPDDARKRYEASVSDRRVMMHPGDNGTAHLTGHDLPPDRVASASRRINTIAMSLRSAHEGRTIDQLRADVFLDLLNGVQSGASTPDRRESSRARGSVDIRVGLTTLLGLDERAGELGGYGPVVSDIARQVVGESPGATWRYSITDDADRVVAVGTTRRRPTAAQRRIVEAINPRCAFPGCRMPATECDLDHRVEFGTGGATDTSNLTPLCRHDHRVRHQAGWKYELLENGQTIWTSPLGRRYTNTPNDGPHVAAVGEAWTRSSPDHSTNEPSEGTGDRDPP